MTRLVVLTLAASMGLATPAFAADSVLATATRLIHEAAKESGPSGMRGQGTPAPPSSAARAARGGGLKTQDQAPGLIAGGMGTGKKIVIGVAIAAAVAGVIYAIDQGVEDNTPSSRGLR
jgi:hypothetical protein